MKKLTAFFALLAICFAVGCTDAIYDSSTIETGTSEPDNIPKTYLTIKNQSSFDLQDFIWNDTYSDRSVPVSKGGSTTLPVEPGTAYLYFSYYPKYGADPGKKLMECKVSEIITVLEDENHLFTFTDNTAIIQNGNSENRSSLGKMVYPTNATLAISFDGRNVDRQDNIDVGITTIDDITTLSFTMSNKGTDKLIFSGNAPITLDNSADRTVFTVTQPVDSYLDSNDTMSFTVKFSPKDARKYSAVISIASNEKAEIYSFTITATGVTPAPKIGIVFNNESISNEGTINFGNIAIGSPQIKEITITNEGAKKLSLTGTQAVTFYGEANGFEIVSQPIPSISAGGSTTFRVKCSPSEVGD